MLYKNLSSFTKKYYGVTFMPGDTKEVSGIINDSKFLKVVSNPDKSNKPKNVVKPNVESNKEVK